ncbi:MAG: UDP-3-O-acyl-N-acetylglucosamine deacetylase, partial [Alphaproteobacteria bacterium HGW-Alphaproteobacteria-10]
APSEETRLCVEVEFDHPLVEGKRAQWQGDPDDFLTRVAPARTFGFRRDVSRLRAAGRARSVDPRSVVVLEDDGTSLSEPPPGRDECVRHKLLDLIGDLTIAGGVPLGVIEARRPGHRATHAVMSMAWAQGVADRSG